MCEYPQNILEELKAHADVTVFDANKEAEKLGNPKVANIILLGSLIGQMNLTNIDWDTILQQNVKPQFVEVNKQALKVGIELAK